MIECEACQTNVLEVFEGDCESCFIKLKVVPLKDIREQTLKELSRIDMLLTTKLEKLARSSRHNLNLSFTCVCGGRFKSGLDLISHLPECGGIPKDSSRSKAHSKLMNGHLKPINPEDLT